MADMTEDRVFGHVAPANAGFTFTQASKESFT